MFLLLLILKRLAPISVAIMYPNSISWDHKLWQFVISFPTGTPTVCRGGSIFFLCQSEQHALHVLYEDAYVSYPLNKYGYVKWAKWFSTDKCLFSVQTFRIKYSFLHLLNIGRNPQNVKCWIRSINVFPAQPSNSSYRKDQTLIRFSVWF